MASRLVYGRIEPALGLAIDTTDYTGEIGAQPRFHGDQY